jgi:hypothetical protein
MSDTEHDYRAVGGIAGAHVSQRQQQPAVPRICSLHKTHPKFAIPVAAMDTPPVAKTDLRPWTGLASLFLTGIVCLAKALFDIVG